MTWRGFCALAPESRNTSPGLCSKIGNSRRSARGSSPARGLVAQQRYAITHSSSRAEPRGQPAQQMLADRRVGDALDRLAQKPFDQHPARLVGRDAAGAQIEQRRLVEIADAGAMAHLTSSAKISSSGLVSIDRAPAEDQIAAGLLRIGLLRALADDDAALERAVPAPRRDALDQLARLRRPAPR